MATTLNPEIARLRHQFRLALCCELRKVVEWQPSGRVFSDSVGPHLWELIVRVK